MILKLLNKIKEFFFPPEQYYLSVQGYYMMRYCKKIYEGSWEEKDYNEKYEDWLNNFKTQLRASDGSEVTLRDAAEAFYQMMLEMEPVPCDDLIEMGVNSLDEFYIKVE